MSIAILDSNSKIVKEASHNASESLYLWWLNASSTFRCEELDTVLFASVQQTFNLGHWFIDSLSRLAYAQPFLKSFDNLTVLIDTKDHIIIKDSLSHFGFSSVKPTLPYSVFKVKTLYVPVLGAFQTVFIFPQSL